MDNMTRLILATATEADNNLNLIRSVDNLSVNNSKTTTEKLSEDVYVWNNKSTSLNLDRIKLTATGTDPKSYINHNSTIIEHSETSSSSVDVSTMSSMSESNSNGSLAKNSSITTGQPQSATNISSKIDWSELISMPKMNNFKDVFTLGCSIAVIFGGLIPYIPQYLNIKRSSSGDGFSTYVCLTLLIANILRIAFWFGHPFEFPLLIQSFVMIAGMIAMMDICIRVRNKDPAYVVSSTSARPITMRGRRSLIGKIFNTVFQVAPTDNDNQNGLNNESTPIYSVTSPSSHSPSSLVPFSTSSSPSMESQQVSSEKISYHQESIDVEATREVTGTAQALHSTFSYSLNHSNINTNSFSSDESPILSNINIDVTQNATSSDCRVTTPAQSPAAHSYANGYLSNRRHKRSALVKWLNSNYFWDWDDLFSYVKFLLFFTTILALITYLLLDNHLYIESLGFIAGFSESMLGIPQLLRNYRKKSTRGMSVKMVVMWLSGDLFKTLYFIQRHSPSQFVVCGTIQVSVDLFILFQVYWYKRPNVTYSKLPKSN